MMSPGPLMLVLCSLMLEMIVPMGAIVAWQNSFDPSHDLVNGVP